MTFDYGLPAELFMLKRKVGLKRKAGARQRLGYRRFATAAEAIRFAVEDFPAIRTLSAWLQVGDERFDREDINRLYLKDDYPLRRRGPMSASGPTSGRMRRSKASKNKMA